MTKPWNDGLRYRRMLTRVRRSMQLILIIVVVMLGITLYKLFF